MNEVMLEYETICISVAAVAKVTQASIELRLVDPKLWKIPRMECMPKIVGHEAMFEVPVSISLPATVLTS